MSKMRECMCHLGMFVEKFYVRFNTQYEKKDIDYLCQIENDRKLRMIRWESDDELGIDYFDRFNNNIGKLEMIRWGTYNEIQDMRYTRYYELEKIYDYYYFKNNFRKKKAVLNKMFKKRRRRETAKNKYLECLSILPRQLPHEIDNIIISYCI